MHYTLTGFKSGFNLMVHITKYNLTDATIVAFEAITVTRIVSIYKHIMDINATGSYP